jgi:hypothetical protein
VIVRRIQIDEAYHPSGIRAGKRGELVAGDRVAGESNPGEPERVEYRSKVGHTAGQIIARARLARRSVASTSDRQDVMIAGELGGEVVESMGHVLQSGQEHERRAGATPIENLKLDSVSDPYVDLTVG